MSRNWFPFLTVLFLLALLALLATLQYQWLGQISDAESVRLTKRLADDTDRFSRDFDQDIQKAYFALMVNPSELRSGDLLGIQKRFAYWQQQAADPGLVKNVYYIDGDQVADLKKIDLKNATFTHTGWPHELAKVRKEIGSSGNSMQAFGNVLVIPLYGKSDKLQEIVVRRRKIGGDEIVHEQNIGGAPNREGFLVIELDREVIKNKLLPRLFEKYFSQDGAGSYELSVTDENGGSLYTTNGRRFDVGDVSVHFFSLRPNEFAFISESMQNDLTRDRPVRKSAVIVNETSTENTVKDTEGKILNVDLKGPDKSLPRISVFEETNGKDGGQWVLNVRHSAGSLEKFISNTRNRNLAISFGILSVLAAGMVLIVIVTQRARDLARRQLEFVSSVSHEFRTPLAVIYSAGENISDGIIDDREKLVSYGEMIKREGARLSSMVEQVLEYAGANSGGRSYELKSDRIAPVIESALEECAPLIEERGFEILQDVDHELPSVMIDRRALVQAVQNLVTNGLKYSNGSRWMKVSAFKEGGDVCISVEDRGIGIAPADVKKVFDPFFRSRSVVDDQISGNGLGLSLVKEIVAGHKGQVSVKSEEGKGSVFTIRIPFVK